ncbi:MAG: serine hydrolase [Bacteroidota bacterium]
MNILKRNLAILLVFFVAFSAAGQDADKRAAEAIDQYLKEKFPATEPGASVLVVHAGKELVRKGYGLADISAKTSNDPETIFRIGSITKQFTSTAILKLAQEGKLKLEDEIIQYLPDYPTRGKKITITHLLQHTSGIRSYTSLPQIMNKETKAKAFAVKEMIDAFKDQPADFNPGEEYRYNNSGYYLLGAIVEKASGMTWGAYLQKNFFKPLKMKSTFTDDKNLSGAARGYVKTSGTEFGLADYVHPMVPYAAGAIFSTVDDLWKWNQAVFSNAVVRQEWLDKAWTPLVLNDGAKQSYGFGWQLGRLGDSRVIGHGGGIDGFLSFSMYVPDQKIYVAVLANSMTISPEDIAYRLASLTAGLSAEPPAAIALEDSKLDQYVGVYKINNNEDRVISKEGSQLYSQRTGGPKYEIYAYGEDAFFFKESPSRLKFKRNTKGAIEAIEMTGREYINQVATRTNKAMPTARKAIKVDLSLYDQYAGDYELAAGFIITVRKEGEKLMAQATGQGAFEIFPESETKFFYTVVDAQIEFFKEGGKVSSLTLYQGGRTLPGKKLGEPAGQK